MDVTITNQGIFVDREKWEDALADFRRLDETQLAVVLNDSELHIVSVDAKSGRHVRLIPQHQGVFSGDATLKLFQGQVAHYLPLKRNVFPYSHISTYIFDRRGEPYARPITSSAPEGIHKALILGIPNHAPFIGDVKSFRLKDGEMAIKIKGVVGPAESFFTAYFFDQRVSEGFQIPASSTVGKVAWMMVLALIIILALVGAWMSYKQKRR